MLPKYFEFSLPVKLVYGSGILKEMNEIIAYLGKKRAMIVTDKIIAKAGPLEKLKSGIEKTEIEIALIFDDVPVNSDIKTVEKCAKAAIENQVDCIIAIGGGSVIDTAKVANLLIVKGGSVEDHMGAFLLDKNEKLLPSIYIPTTSGTGSEVTKVAVISDPKKDVKLPFSEDQFLPDIAILDPEVTLTLPPVVTAGTGMDALTHAVEAYVDKEASPASDAMALHAIKLIYNNILQACANPKNLEARGAMLVGSALAGIAFSHSMVGMVHGISHALGGVYHIPHGLANALVLPEVMEYNLEVCTSRYADIAFTLGVAFPQLVSESQNLIKSDKFSLVSRVTPFIDFKYLKDQLLTTSRVVRDGVVKILDNVRFVDDWFKIKAAEEGIAKIRKLNRQLAYLTKMPLNLADAGIKDKFAKLDQVVKTAMEDGAMLYNPVEPEADAISKILEKIYKSEDEPLLVSEDDLISVQARSGGKELINVFKDSEMLYDILYNFYKVLEKNKDLGPALKKTKLCIQFIYKNPNAIITIDSRGEKLKIVKGEFDGKPDVIMTMNADFAHKFWHGKANLVSALTRRLVKAKGNVPSTIKLLPILKPAYKLYPEFLREKGFDDLII
jgi:alcohol dehydrogenase